MGLWSYRCYDDGRTPQLWQRWYDENPEFRGTHDAVFDQIEQMTLWEEPHVKLLLKTERIFEVRLNGKVRHRILGFYGEARREFVIVATCYHKQSNYYPPGIRDTAAKRKKQIEAQTREAPSCVRPKDPS